MTALTVKLRDEETEYWTIRGFLQNISLTFKYAGVTEKYKFQQNSSFFLNYLCVMFLILLTAFC